MTGAASCRDCGRPLSDPESQLRGQGPDCYRKEHGPPSRRRRADQPIAGFPDLARAPRRWRSGDRPPPLTVRRVRDRDGDRWHRVGRDGWIPDGGDPDYTSAWQEVLRFAPLIEDNDTGR